MFCCHGHQLCRHLGAQEPITWFQGLMNILLNLRSFSHNYFSTGITGYLCLQKLLFMCFHKASHHCSFDGLSFMWSAFVLTEILEIQDQHRLVNTMQCHSLRSLCWCLLFVAGCILNTLSVRRICNANLSTLWNLAKWVPMSNVLCISLFFCRSIHTTSSVNNGCTVLRYKYHGNDVQKCLLGCTAM
jgi:hypothetical protein